MRRLFANIRKSLLESGRAKKYIIYAVGEILLIVFGILVALQINNFNEERQDHKKETQLVSALSLELSDNQKYLDWRIDYLTSQVERSGIALLKSTGPNPPDIGVDSIAGHIYDLVYLVPYSPVTAKFHQVMSSDESNLIKSDSLMQMLINYQAALELADWPQFEMRDQILEYLQAHFSPLQMLRSQSERIFESLLKEDFTANYFPIEGKNLLADATFQGMIVTRLEANAYTMVLLSSLQKRVQDIQDFILRNYAVD